MDKYPLIKNSLVIGIILIFIGVAFAPSINVHVVKASYDNDLAKVTTQACGIKGFGTTTVKLTRQQHQNLKEYFVEFQGTIESDDNQRRSNSVIQRGCCGIEQIWVVA